MYLRITIASFREGVDADRRRSGASLTSGKGRVRIQASGSVCR